MKKILSLLMLTLAFVLQPLTTALAHGNYSFDDDLGSTEDALLGLMGIDDDSLGAVITRSLATKGVPMKTLAPQTQKAIIATTKQVAVMKTQKDNRSKLLTRGGRFLMHEMNTLEEETKRAIKEERLQLVDRDLYARIRLTGQTGQIYLLEANNKIKRVGHTNFINDFLPDYNNMVINRIRLGYATSPLAYSTNGTASTTASTEGSVIYLNSFTPAQIPAAVLNGELIIEQNGTPILIIPIVRFFNVGNTNFTTGSQGYGDAYQLENMKLLKEKHPITIYIRTADGVPVTLPAGAVEHYLEVRLIGVCTTHRGNNK